MISIRKINGGNGSNSGRNIKLEVEFDLARQIISDNELLSFIDSMHL